VRELRRRRGLSQLRVGARDRLAGGLVATSTAVTPRTILLILLLGMAAGCTLSHGRHPSATATQSPTSTPAPRTTTIVTLLADNHLLAVTTDPAQVVADLRLGPVPDPLGVSHAMALTADGSTLYLLVPRGADQPQTPDQLVTFDLPTRHVRARHLLDTVTSYRSLALGPRSGQLYLFGNRHQAAGQAAVVAVVDPASGTIRSRWTIRPASGRTWLVYRGVVSDDERRLVVSYHGPDTTGADVLTNTGGRLRRCAAAAPPGAGCLADVHGDIILASGRLLATTGDPRQVEAWTLDGRLRARWDSGLSGNHLTELAVNAATRRLYAIGSCGYTGGLSVIDLDRGRARRLAAPTPGGGGAGAPQPPICGERIETGPGDLLSVARTSRPVPNPQSPGALLLIDARDGRLLHTVSTPSEPVDLLVAP
jgi:hypothetical protein